MNTAMSNAHDKAKEFLEQEKAFRLGQLLTESSHPKTRRLSQTMDTDIEAGVRLLQSVDEDIPAAVGRIFAQDSFPRLVEAFGAALRAGRRIFFTGCGATGRLSILLEAAWRRFWRERESSWRGRPALVCAEGVGLPNAKEGVGDPVPPSDRGHELAPAQAGDARDTMILSRARTAATRLPAGY